MLAAPSADERLLAEFTVTSNSGNERLVMNRVAEAVEGLEIGGKSPRAAEDGRRRGGNERDRAREREPLRSSRSQSRWSHRGGDSGWWCAITDQGGERPISEAESPDLEAKLEGLQKPGAGAAS